MTPVFCFKASHYTRGKDGSPSDITPSIDDHKYKALGNSMAVPVMQWIGERIHLALMGVLQDRLLVEGKRSLDASR